MKNLNITIKTNRLLFCALSLLGMSAVNQVSAQDTTYAFTGGTQFYVVPSNVFAINIESIGAGGGAGINGISGVAGKGASMKGYFEVAPGDTLEVLVGGKGQDAEYIGGGGGYSGGGAISGEYNGGGGGGSVNAGTDQENMAGVGVGNGSVIITEVCVPIVVSFTTGDELLGADGTITTTISGGSNTFVYDWDNDGTGDFDDPQNLTGLTGGTYNVVIRDSSICEDLTETVVVNSQLSLGEDELNVELYPNPVVNQLQIEANGTFSFEVVSSTGAIVRKGSGVLIETVTMSDLAPGSYFVTIKSDQYNKTITIVKQ